jgi:putative DNA primase/helicase
MNNLPYTQGDSSFGLLRRLLIIKYNVIIKEEDIDHDLENKLIKELPGIFNLALKGAQRLLLNRQFTNSQTVKDEVENYEKNINMVKRFILDLQIQHDEKERVGNQQLYAIFKNWCEEEGIKAPTKRYLIEKLKSAGFLQYKNNAIRGFMITYTEPYSSSDPIDQHTDTKRTKKTFKKPPLVRSVDEDNNE